jgi:GDPmannose 4,6-dehydratase
MKKALITGITGQDGSYLAELLLSKGYQVHGIIRRSSSFNTARLDRIYQDPHESGRSLFLHYGDVTDSLSIDTIMHEVLPDEIYHLGAQSHVHVSFDVPGYTAQTDAVGTLNMLEAMRKHVPKAKFYNAATSELFGKVLETPQKETTPFNPRSPYGVAKLYAFHIVKNYREAYNMFCVNGILFNHESERRGSTFVTKKITEGLIKYMKNGTPFYLGNVYAKRDWGYAPDFVEGMYLMLQQENPEDFVLATGETHTIKDFVNECHEYANKNIYEFTDNGNIYPPIPMLRYGKSSCPSFRYEWEWKLDDKNREIFWDNTYNRLIIGIDEKYYRPAEVDLLLGDASKAKEKLGWEPKTKFVDLVERMMKNEVKPI